MSIRQNVKYTKEGAHGVTYSKRNMRDANEARYYNPKREQHNRKQKTENRLHTGSGGMSGTAFSAINSRMGASVGGQFGKWSGEIIAHRNISGMSSEEVKRVRKDTPQTALHLKLGKGSIKHNVEPSGLNYSNLNGSFSNSDFDMMQNPEEDPHLELSEGPSLNTFKAGLSGTKHQFRRYAGDTRSANPDEVI